jgi:dTDP-4-dehydrorhamnose 3,5-epimerase-like enzyme
MDDLIKKFEIIKDDRGAIINLLENVKIKGVSLIYSKAGTTRSNHYHRDDWHYLYVMEGKMAYFERSVLEGTNPYKKPVIVERGQMVFSPPMKVHRTDFLEDTVLICLSKQAKNGNHDMIKMDY